jgi:Rrf2 family protein
MMQGEAIRLPFTVGAIAPDPCGWIPRKPPENDMSKLVHISEAASLGLHTMALLVSDRDKRFTNQEIADTLGASSHHLAKVMQRLVKIGLVDSTVGPQGGFQLIGEPKEITLSQIYEAVDGPLEETGCLLNEPACDARDCVLGDVLRQVHQQVRDYLEETTLATLAEGARLGAKIKMKPKPKSKD